MVKTWKQFLEAKGCKLDIEKEEEKLGKDLDGDKEKGEPFAHKKKVFGKKVEKEEEDEE